MSGGARDAHSGQAASASPAVLDIVDRIEERIEKIGRELLARYRDEILDYRGLDHGSQLNDVIATATQNLEILIATCRSDGTVDDDSLDYFRRSGVRRAAQGIPIESLQRAYRLWGQLVWEEVLAITDDHDVSQLEAALWMSGKIMAHVDAVTVVVTQAYLDELAGVSSGRGMVSRDLLEALLEGAVTGRAIRNATALGLEADARNLVIVARSMDKKLIPRERVRDALKIMLSALAVDRRTVLVGARDEELVAILSATDGWPVQLLACARTISERLDGFFVGVGRWHDGFEGIATSYIEAKDAADIALATGVTPPAASFDQVLVAHMLRSSPQAESLLGDTLSALQRYDASRNAHFVATLAAYFQAGFHLTRAASVLHVRPNTVTYRLQRIHAITGRDPANPDDLLLLVLGLKLLELGDAASPNASPGERSGQNANRSREP